MPVTITQKNVRIFSFCGHFLTCFSTFLCCVQNIISATLNKIWLQSANNKKFQITPYIYIYIYIYISVSFLCLVTWATKQFPIRRQQRHKVNDFPQKPTLPLYFIGAVCLIIIFYQRLHLPTLRLVLRLALWLSCVIDTHTLVEACGRVSHRKNGVLSDRKWGRRE